MLIYLYEWNTKKGIDRRIYTFSEKDCDDLLTQPYVMQIKAHCLLTGVNYVLNLLDLNNILEKGIKL